MKVLFISKNKPKKECGTTFIARAVCANEMGLIFILPLIEVQLGLIDMGASVPIFDKMLSAYTDKELVRLGNKYCAEMLKPNSDIDEAIGMAVDELDIEIAAAQKEADEDAIDQWEEMKGELGQS